MVVSFTGEGGFNPGALMRLQPECQSVIVFATIQICSFAGRILACFHFRPTTASLRSVLFRTGPAAPHTATLLQLVIRVKCDAQLRKLG